ncbi:MAG: DnaD domain protein, partial [Selenomonas massiliensis]
GEYGVLWVTSAIEEAALSNGRNLRYIAAILERWKREGFKSPRKGVRQHGTGRNDSRAALEERYSDFAEADRKYRPPWEVQPPDGADTAASG